MVQQDFKVSAFPTMNKHLFAVIYFVFFFSSCGKDSSTQNNPNAAAISTQLNAMSSKLPQSETDSTLYQTQAATFTSNDPGWLLTFSDEFDDKATSIAKGANPECFSKSPTCMINWWARTDCPEYATKLADLNKCNWDVYQYYNYMDWDAPEGTGINAFNPNQVKVQNGHLILSAEKSNISKPSCKVKFLDPRIGFDNYTFECPIISGGVESRRHGSSNQYGFSQKFGRFEVRAKLNHGPGSWPAHWLLPEEPMEPGCGWPYSGEIDIMEATFLNHNVAGANFHTGDCQKKSHVSSGFNWSVTGENYPNIPTSDLENSLYDTFHTYAVEWDESKLRFFYDDFFLGQINENDIIFNDQAPTGHRIVIPKKPFYWILNNTIFNANNPTNVDVQNFVRQEHVIDYVRVYRKCSTQDDPIKCVKVDYKNTMTKCPGIRTDIGDYKNKNLCKAWPHFSISAANCFGNSGEISTIASGEWCAINEGTWYKARKITRDCPLGYDKIGDKGFLPACKAMISFEISRSHCDGESWTSTSGTEYCLWAKDGWFKARKVK